MVECKRYIVLAGLYYHPRSWGEQYSRSFDSLDEAKSWARDLCCGYSFYNDWFEIVDLTNMHVVDSSKTDWNKQPKLRVKAKGKISES